jgi:CII-binding regulator of phage lambda lysogenization HflD
VRLDADAVLSASARVLSQAVKYIAMTQGVGGLVSSATNTVDGVASSATNVLFDSEILTSKLSNLQREIKQANSQFLSEMMSLEKLLNSNNTNITDNKKKVKVVTENHKLRLQTITEKYK